MKNIVILLVLIYFSPSICAQTTHIINVENWLNNNLDIKNSIIWINENSAIKYDDWTDSMKYELQVATEAYANNQNPFGLNGIPTVTEHGLDKYYVSDRSAWVYYIAYVAFSINADIMCLTPWKLSDLNSISLLTLFDSRGMLYYSSFFDGYQFRYVTPAPPNYIFEFLENNALIGLTRAETIARVIEWCKNLSHYYHMAGDDRNSAYFATWQYYGEPPVVRTIEGTVRTPGINALSHYTGGCHGTVGFIRTLLQTLNIPTRYLRTEGHAQPYFTHENLYLSHGDDPYSGSIIFNDVNIPAQKILIDSEDFQRHFGSQLTSEERLDNIGYRTKELGVEYLSLSYCRKRCLANDAGLTNLEFYEELSDNAGIDKLYTYPELVALDFFYNLDNKISNYGGCSVNYNFYNFPAYPPPLVSGNLIQDMWFYGQIGEVEINYDSSIITAEIEPGCSLEYIIPHFCLSEKSRINYNSGTYIDFRNPVKFRVIAENSRVKTWTINIEDPNECFDSYEANNSIASATAGAFSSLGSDNYSESITATLHSSDHDVYRIFVDKKGILEVNLPNPPKNFDLKFTSSLNGLLATSHKIGSESFKYSFSDTGYYYIHVYSHNGEYSCSDYNLGITWTCLPSKATNPNPDDSSTDLSVAVNPSWTNGGAATSYDIYFGTDPSPDAGEYQGNTSSTDYHPGTLEYNTTYYWRIDAVNSAGNATGNIWNFTTTAAPYLNVDPSSRTVGSETGTTSYTISTNVDWSSSENISWLSTIANDNNTLTVKYDENISQETRSAGILITGSGLNPISVIIEQEGAESTAITNVFENTAITIYPNPASEKLYLIPSSDLNLKIYISLYDNTGRQLYSKIVNDLSARDPLEIDFSYYNPGLFILQLYDTNSIIIEKIIKK